MSESKVFYLGQIEKEHRGDLTAVVAENKGELGTLVYPTSSEEIYHATGVMTAQTKVLRTYIGINQESGEAIARLTSGQKREGFDLRHKLDFLVVHSYFLNQDREEKPKQIIFDLYRDGKYHQK